MTCETRCDRARAGQWYEIVGVVADLQNQRSTRPWSMRAYFNALDPRQTSVLTLIVRTRGGARATSPARCGPFSARSIHGADYAAADIELYRQMDLACASSRW